MSLRLFVRVPAGQLRCRACGKALLDHGALAQHLKDAHGGRNSPSPAAARQPQDSAGSDATATARRKPAGATSLADLLDAALRKRTAVGQAVEARQQQRRERPAVRSAATHKKGIQGTIRVRTRYKGRNPDGIRSRVRGCLHRFHIAWRRPALPVAGLGPAQQQAIS